MSEWLTHLNQFYKDKKKTVKDYSYKQAMTDAAKTYRKRCDNLLKRSTRRKSVSKKRKTLSRR